MEYLSALFVFAFTASVTPGPNNVMLMTSGVNFGVKQSLPHMLGVCIGFPVMLILVGSGLGFVFETYPMIHQVIKVIGVLYLLYLAWLIANSAPGSMEGRAPRPIKFIEAALFQWVNPKAWIMATGAVAAYTTLSANIYLQVLFIALVFFSVAIPSASVWLFFGVWLKNWLKSPGVRKKFNIAMALLLVLSVLPIVRDMVRHWGG